jgi:translation initiation factor IF-2
VPNGSAANKKETHGGIVDVIEGKKQMLLEVILGRAKILASFPFEKTLAYGISIVEGRIVRGDKVRIMRGENVIGETTIQSLRVGKNVTSKVNKGEVRYPFEHESEGNQR